MENKTQILDFEHLSNTLEERLLQFKKDKKEFYVCDRITDNGSFLSLYKDALFNYRDGVLLCERIYLQKSVQYETREIIKDIKENKALYGEFLDFANHNLMNENANPEEVAEKLKEYSDKFQNENIPKENIKIPYYQLPYSSRSKILLTKLSDFQDDAIKTIARVMAEYIISFYRTMFFVNEQDYGIVLRSIETDTYIDIIAIIIKKQD
jgi:hypothetical protein